MYLIINYSLDQSKAGTCFIEGHSINNTLGYKFYELGMFSLFVLEAWMLNTSVILTVGTLRNKNADADNNGREQ